jgi:hypothetical protein
MRYLKPTSRGYKKITPKILNSWLETAAKDSSVEVVQALLVFRPPQFLLGFKAMGAICRSGDYQMVNSTFNTIDHPAHPSSAQHPLHIAVRTGIVASVKAIVDTTKYKINRRLNSNIHLYPVNAITALDVAIYHDLIERETRRCMPKRVDEVVTDSWRVWAFTYVTYVAIYRRVGGAVDLR